MKTTWMPAVILAGALAAPAAVAAVSGTSATKTQASETLKVGSTVPADVALKDFEGVGTSFDDLRGKVVILHFWSDRCPAEKHADPVFVKMDEKYAESKDVVMLGIASNQNELGDAPGADADYSKYYKSLRAKRDKVGYQHTILADHGNVVSDLFGARSTPHCYVIDQKGVIQYAGALDDDPRGKKGDEATNYLVDATTAILAGKKPAVTSTKSYG